VYVNWYLQISLVKLKIVLRKIIIKFIYNIALDYCGSTLPSRDSRSIGRFEKMRQVEVELLKKNWWDASGAWVELTRDSRERPRRWRPASGLHRIRWKVCPNGPRVHPDWRRRRWGLATVGGCMEMDVWKNLTSVGNRYERCRRWRHSRLPTSADQWVGLICECDYAGDECPVGTCWWHVVSSA